MIATMNPVELGQGTFPLSEAAANRVAVVVNIGYLPPEEEAKLVNLDFKRVQLNALMTKDSGRRRPCGDPMSARRHYV